MARQRGAWTTLGVLMVALLLLGACGGNSSGGAGFLPDCDTDDIGCDAHHGVGESDFRHPFTGCHRDRHRRAHLHHRDGDRNRDRDATSADCHHQPISDLGCNYPQQTDALTAEDTPVLLLGIH